MLSPAQNSAESRPSQPLRSALVVDDSDVQRRHLLSLCRAAGIVQLHEATDGEHALRVLGGLQTPPELVIVDLEMPGMDGIELIQQMRQRSIDLPIVVASSREESLIAAVEVVARNLGLNVVAGLRKPLDAAALNRAFDRAREMRTATKPVAFESANSSQPVDTDRLAQAIASGDIKPHYQPKVDIGTGLLRGVEALARWSDVERGPIRPDLFIAAAERHGLIHALTLSMLEQALAQAHQWNARGLRLSVAVNLSPQLLDAPALVDELTALCTRHRLDAAQLVLEITESSVVTSHSAALGVLARLRMRGFKLSIDDYGTGFSSMQQLARIPFTELKVDRSFVDGASRHDNLRVILQSALEMASRLGLTTVAEGIERMDDWRLLQQFGCTTGQGFLIARPMAASALPGWLKSHSLHLPQLRRAREGGGA